MDRASTGRALLALCGHRAAELTDASSEVWEAIDQLAHEHRLRPFLHGRLARGEISGVPDSVAQVWREAARANAIMILAQRRALAKAAATLGSLAIKPVALKGAALAWTVWPSPAERVMRDIDILVAQENAGEAYRALREAGWKAPDLGQEALANFAQEETHFPPLYSPEGVMCELHGHVWSKAPLPAARMPVSDDTGFLDRAEFDDELGIACPSSEDMLAHLVVHGACSHLLNVGPMALVDVDLWCSNRQVDWNLFWQRAEADEYERPAALLFALVDRWRSPGFLAASRCRLSVTASLLDEAEMLLVQDLDQRKDVSAIASLASGQLGGRLQQHPLDRAEAEVSGGGRLGQLSNRAASLGGSLLSKTTRRNGIATARLQKWIEG